MMKQQIKIKIKIKKVLEISDGYKIKYDNNNGKLEDVPFFIYNITYSFATLFFDLQAVQLIIGTSGANGLVATDIALDIDIFSPKNFGFHAPIIQTITKLGVVNKSGVPTNSSVPSNEANKDSSTLVPFGGYYRIDGLSQGAFISIQTKQYYIGDKIDDNVFISVSIDGIKSTKYLFDKTMSFDGTTLIIPNTLNVNFTQKYVANGNYATLVQVNGKINDKPITGCTYFHPVKLSQFIGNYYQPNDTNPTLEIIKESSKKWKVAFKAKVGDQDIDISTDNFMYIPIMYVGVIYPDKYGIKAILLEFGINACGISISYNDPAQKNAVLGLMPFKHKGL